MAQDNYQVIDAGNGLFIIEEAIVRSFLLVGAEKALLIDSGCEIENMREIAEGLTDRPIMLAHTHADPDHIRCSGQFEEIYMHPAEYAHYHRLTGRKDRLRPLWDGEVIALGDAYVWVLMNPGHTPGSITFLDSRNRRLIGGDSIQDGRIFMFGEYRDLCAYLHSMERMEEYAGSFDLIYPSHAKCPVETEIIPKLIAGTKRLLAGELTGEPAQFRQSEVTAFDIGCATLLCDKE